MTVYKTQLIEFHSKCHLWGALLILNNKNGTKYLSSVELEILLSQVPVVWQEI